MQRRTVLALTVSLHWRGCQTAQPVCHKHQQPGRCLPRTQQTLVCFPSSSSPQSAPLLPGALLSIFLQGQDALSCSSCLLWPLPFGCFLWGPCLVVPGPAGPQSCQTCLLWALGALFLFVAQSKSGLLAHPGGCSIPGAAWNRLARTQGFPGAQALY